MIRVQKIKAWLENKQKAQFVPLRTGSDGYATCVSRITDGAVFGLHDIVYFNDGIPGAIGCFHKDNVMAIIQDFNNVWYAKEIDKLKQETKVEL